MQRACGNAAVSQVVAAHRLQRYVDSFDVEFSRSPTPAQDLKETLLDNSELFEDPDEQIEAAVDDAPLTQRGTEDIEKPEEVSATLRAGKNRSPKRDDLSAKVGWIGHDEFWIKRGVKETFEGGHVIPHALFDEDDEDADMAGAYENLVPMSRYVNIDAWKAKEAAIKTKLTEIAKDDDDDVEHSLEITIPVAASEYEMWASVLAERLGLTFNDDVDDEQLTLFEWIPRSLGPVSTQHIRTRKAQPSSPLSEDEFSEVEDNPLRTWSDEIQTGEELLAAIKSVGLRVHPSLLTLISTFDQ